MSFNEDGELEAGLDILNWVTFPNQSFIRVKVGEMDLQAPRDQMFSINEKNIVWQNGFNQVGSNWDISGPLLNGTDLLITLNALLGGSHLAALRLMIRTVCYVTLCHVIYLFDLYGHSETGSKTSR